MYIFFKNFLVCNNDRFSFEYVCLCRLRNQFLLSPSLFFSFKHLNIDRLSVSLHRQWHDRKFAKIWTIAETLLKSFNGMLWWNYRSPQLQLQVNVLCCVLPNGARMSIIYIELFSLSLYLPSSCMMMKNKKNKWLFIYKRGVLLCDDDAVACFSLPAAMDAVQQLPSPELFPSLPVSHNRTTIIYFYIYLFTNFQFN